MAYPKDLLAPDEEIVVDERTHWKALIGAVATTILALVLGGLAWWWMASVEWSSGLETGVGIAVAVTLIVFVVWLAVSPYIRWATTHFVITDRRVIYRTGVFTKSGIDIPLARVNSVQFRHGFIDQLFRTGTLIIESASDDPLEFNDIPNVEKVHAILYHQVNEVIEDEDER
ncbi:PH domain-containing protein [Demequina salsinemoris]|uniref:PH domain-containing protein n=1 Tax=Demequina salsinemoris TaxID=577470 RepID=UPI000785C249|nr:PH domain-containing protein [Demequina salsinemoris]